MDDPSNILSVRRCDRLSERMSDRLAFFGLCRACLGPLDAGRMGSSGPSGGLDDMPEQGISAVNRTNGQSSDTYLGV